MSSCFPAATENKECKNSGQIFQLNGSLNNSAKNPIFLRSITAKIRRENLLLHTVMKCKDMARNMITILLRKNKNLIFGIYKIFTRPYICTNYVLVFKDVFKII